MQKIDEIYVKTSDIAKLFGLSARRVQQLNEDGIIGMEEMQVRGKPAKKYKLIDTVNNYIGHLRKKADGVQEKKEDRLRENKKLDAEIRFKEARAAAAEMNLAELEGKLHRSEDVENMTTDLVLTIRSALLSLPGMLAKDVSEMNDAAECSELIRTVITDILEDLSKYEYNPEEYMKRCRERQGWDDDDEEKEESD